MSLPLLVIIVTIGIAATVIAVHMTGGSKRAALENADEARQAFAADFPDETADTVVLTENGQSAFLPLADGRIGIVQSFGDGFFTRIVSANDVAEIKLREPAIVSIRFKDFTWTGGHFSFAEPRVAQDVASWLTAEAA